MLRSPSYQWALAMGERLSGLVALAQGCPQDRGSAGHGARAGSEGARRCCRAVPLSGCTLSKELTLGTDPRAPRPSVLTILVLCPRHKRARLPRQRLQVRKTRTTEARVTPPVFAREVWLTCCVLDVKGGL